MLRLHIILKEAEIQHLSQRWRSNVRRWRPEDTSAGALLHTPAQVQLFPVWMNRIHLSSLCSTS